MLIVSAREFSQLNANRLFNGNMCPIAFRSARGNSRVDCFGFGGCLSLPLPRSGEGVWSLWFDAHAGGLADVSLTQVPQPPRSPPAWLCLQICGSVWLGAFAPGQGGRIKVNGNTTMNMAGEHGPSITASGGTANGATVNKLATHTIAAEMGTGGYLLMVIDAHRVR